MGSVLEEKKHQSVCYNMWLSQENVDLIKKPTGIASMENMHCSENKSYTQMTCTSLTFFIR